MGAKDLIPCLKIHASALVALALFSVPCAFAQTTSTWGGGAGGWFNLNNISNGCENWSTCAANGTGTPGEGGDTFNVVIDAPGSAVTLNGGAVILNMTVGAHTSMTGITTSYLDFDSTCGACTLNNAGAMTFTAASHIIISSSSLTIQGGGTLTLASPNTSISGPGVDLFNLETIQGQGALGLGATRIVNQQGTIDANVSGGTLFVQSNAGGLVNTGVLEASNGGTLSIIQSAGVPLNNAFGTIEALNGSTVMNAAGVITGGTLTTVGTGIIQSSGNPVLNNLTNAGAYVIPLSNLATLEGTINNTGTIAIGSAAGNGTLDIMGNVTLSGPGTVTLVDSGIADSGIHSAFSGGQLTNLNTIQGAGVIGDAGLTIINQGSIIANAHDPLTFAADAGFTNNGLVQATNGATLNIFSHAFNNQGTLDIASGSTVTFNGPYKLLNYSATTNTLTGGTYSVAGTLQFGNAANGIVAINTNAANIVLNGSGSQILNALNGDALAGLSTNAAGASFAIENGRNFTTSGAFLNAGTLTVGNGSAFNTGAGGASAYTQSGASSVTTVQPGGSFHAASVNFTGGAMIVNGMLDPLSLNVCTSCRLSGSGTVSADVTSNGSISPGASPSAPGTLSISGNYAQAAGGVLVIDMSGAAAGQYGVLKVSGNAALDGTVDFVASSGFHPTTGDDFTFLLFGGKSGDFSNIVFTDWTCPTGDTCSEVLGSGTLSLDISGSGGGGGGGSAVPEPPTWLLTALGLFSLILWRRRRPLLNNVLRLHASAGNLPLRSRGVRQPLWIACDELSGTAREHLSCHPPRAAWLQRLPHAASDPAT
jgi:hypothetical protein